MIIVRSLVGSKRLEIIFLSKTTKTKTKNMSLKTFSRFIVLF